MTTFDLTQKVKIVTANASSDSQYGPYNSIGEALTATENLRELGRTVGIIENGVILEYWFKDGITDNDLIPKTTGSNGSGGFFKEITKDGDFTAEKIEGGADDGKYRFKIKGDETLEWTIGDTDYVYNLDSNDEWTFIADALGSGVERRIDAVSYNNAGEIQCFKGTETGQASYPNVPETHILKTFVTITEDGVVVEDGGFITKASEGWNVISYVTGSAWSETINGHSRNITFQNNNPSTPRSIPYLLYGSLSTTLPVSPFWNGMKVKFRNTGDVDTIFKHSTTITPPTANKYKMIFPNGEDFVLKKGEILTLILIGDSFHFYNVSRINNDDNTLTNDDNTLYIEDDIIRLNVTDITEEFVCDGSRNFEMTNTYSSIENVFIQGVRISEEDYTVISEQEIEIEETVTLLDGDNVTIQGTMFIIPEE